MPGDVAVPFVAEANMVVGQDQRSKRDWQAICRWPSYVNTCLQILALRLTSRSFCHQRCNAPSDNAVRSVLQKSKQHRLIAINSQK